MSIATLFQWLSSFLSQIYQIGNMPLFGNVTINDFWFGLAIMSILIGVLIVFAKSVPIHSFGSFSGYESDIKRNKIGTDKNNQN